MADRSASQRLRWDRDRTGGRLVVITVALLLAADRSWAQSVQSKTHLGGKPSGIVQLVTDCSSLPNFPCVGICEQCEQSDPSACDHGTSCPSSCSTAADCSCGTGPCGQCPLNGWFAQCVQLCQIGTDQRGACTSDADCPHGAAFRLGGDTCPAFRAGDSSGTPYSVPVGATLVVTDLLGAGYFEFFTDDRTIDLHLYLSSEQHFTAGLTFPAGSRLNVTAGSTGSGMGFSSSLVLIGYLARRG